MITVLIALGPNNVEVPCRIMESVKAAQEFCEGLGLKPTIKNKLAYDLPNLDDDRDMAAKIFTRYYGGCGDAYRLRIEEIEFDTPFVGFDLD